MKRSILTQLVALTVLVSLAVPAGARSIKDTPGYVDLEWIKIPPEADEIQDIDLGAVLLGLAASAEENQDEAFLKALAMIKSIRVKSWSLDGADPTAQKAIDRITDRLDKDDWQRLIYMKDDDETVTVSTRYEGKNMVGLMLVTYEPGDSVAFVNVVGDLDLGTMLSLAKQFDEDSIAGMLEELDGVQGVSVDHEQD